MVQTVKEKLFESVVNKCENKKISLRIYYAVQQGMVGLDDPASAIPYDQLDYDVIKKMPYEIDSFRADIKLLGIRKDSEKVFLYFAKTEEDARALHYQVHGNYGHRLLDLTDKLQGIACCMRTKECKSLLDLMRGTDKFPHIIGEGPIPEKYDIK